MVLIILTTGRLTKIDYSSSKTRTCSGGGGVLGYAPPKKPVEFQKYSMAISCN